MRRITALMLVSATAAVLVALILLWRRPSGQTAPSPPKDGREVGVPTASARPDMEVGKLKPKTPRLAKPPIRQTQTARPMPKKSMVLTRDGALRSRDSVRGEDVLAEIYDSAPNAAVNRLREILLSGSNEHAEFTRTEKYPPWVFDKIREMVPGQLGEVLAYFAQRETTLDVSVRPAPALDLRDDEEYITMYIGPWGEIPVAETKFGTVWVNRHYGAITPADLAAWMAHRLAAGDENLRLPRLPPKGYSDWEDWVRRHMKEEGAKMLEEIGLLPKRG